MLQKIKKLGVFLISMFISTSEILTAMPATVQAADTHYSVTFDANKGYFANNKGTTQYNKISVTDSDGDGSVTVKYPLEVASILYSAKKPGYTLSGWTDGSETVAASALDGHTFRLSKNTTYKAVWEGEEYNVKLLDVNGQQVGSTIPMTLGADNDLSLAALNVSAEDLGVTNHFIGWDYTYSDGTSIFFDGSNSTIHTFLDDNDRPLFESKDVSLKAVNAVSTTITVSFDINGGSTGTMADQDFSYGSLQKLRSNKFLKTNYKFTGWSTSPDATIAEFIDGHETACNFGFAQDTTLYAVWTPEQSPSTESYQVQFIQNVVNTDSGSTKYSNHAAAKLSGTPTQYYDNSAAKISSALPYQQGFYVSGFHIVKIDDNGEIVKKSISYHPGSKWSLNGEKILIESSEGKFAESLAEYLSSDNQIYLLPDWGQIVVKIGYAPNSSGSGESPAPFEVTLEQAAKLATNTYTSTAGKSFMGWSTEAAATADNMYIDGATASANMVYPAEYRVRSSLDSEQPYPLFTDPFTKYLDMKNWSSAFSTSTYYSNGVLDLTNYSGYKIYAIWDDNTYTIHYDSNASKLDGATGTMEDQVAKVDGTTTLLNVAFSVPGYTFTEWNTKADRTGTKYQNKQAVTALAGRNETVTLYAQWSKEKIFTLPLKVEQKWSDNSNQDGLRPKTMKYTINATANNKTLTAADLGIESLIIEANSNDSTVTLAQVPKTILMNGSYHNIAYKVTTTIVSSYTSSVEYTTTAAEIKATYTYTHNPASKNYTVTIRMSDGNNQDGKRPKTVSLTLKGSDGSTHTASVTITGETTTHIFDHVPTYANGTQISYTVTVNAVDGYTANVTNGGSTSTATLTHTPETMSVNVKVTWKDDDNKSNTRPSAVSASYVANSGTSHSVHLTESNGWNATISGIAKYYQGGASTGSLTVNNVEGYSAQVSGSASSGFTITLSLTNLAKKKAEAAAAASTEASTEKAKTTKKTAKATKEDLRSITVRTIWNDNGMTSLRPLAMKITLVGSDGNKYDKSLTSTTGYSAVFNDLPIKDAETEKEVTYKISYSPISGYTTHVYHNRKNPDEFIIENFMPAGSNLSSGALSSDSLTSTGTIGSSTTLPSTPTGSNTQIKDENLITIGAPRSEENEDTLYANEDGTIREADTDIIADKPKETLIDKISNQKYLIPGAIIGGIVLLAIALLVSFISRISKK